MELTLVKITCAYCGKKRKKYIGHVNRANSIGAPVYCNRTCAGLARRSDKTIEEKKKEKAEYDREYRRKNFEYVKERVAAYFKKDYVANPEKYRLQRKGQKQNHLRHISTPEYRKWKRDYDQKHLAKKDYGIFWECSILLKELEQWLLNNSPDGMHFQMGITNKTQIRKRLWQRTQKKQQKNFLQQI